MKKINSIWFGPRILAAVVIFTLAIPALLYFIHKLLIPNVLLQYMIKVSLVIGILTLLIFLLILFIELKQDKRINKLYNKVKCEKIQITKGIYECQCCGNQKVQEKDSYCRVCGVRFIC